MTTEHGFKTEVQQLLDLMAHSLYSEREIFLRELLSNAADALDRARFLALTRDDLTPLAGDEPGVRVTVEGSVITIEDDGIGLSEAEAIENLGTIAHSGSKAFLQALKDSDHKPEVIGQFGVGFYSAFMVADEVIVESRSALPDEHAVLWKSEGKGTYTIEEGTREHRGTRITLMLKDDADEFADAHTLRRIVKKYSNFLSWPIQVDGEQANAAKALWLEPSSAVSNEDAEEFYKELTLDWNAPAFKIHTSVDSPIQYTALLFVPSERPWDLFQPEVDRGPRLYARRVLIAEHAKDLLPDWLRFLRGVVSSEDIALNVSREMVQKTPVVRKIRSALTTKVLKELERFAGRGAEEEGDEAPYFGFWRNFGGLMKEGYYHEGSENRERLLPLLRFNALSHSDGNGLLSLAEYKEAMPEGQDAIWFMTAPSRETALQSPHLEALKKRGWDVLLLTDPVDEWLVGLLTEVDGTPLKSVTRGELDLEASDEGERADLTGLAPWLETLYGGQVAGVRASGRLTDSAVVLVDGEDGVSSNMERLLKMANRGDAGVPSAKRFLEINAGHRLIKNLALLHEAGRQAQAEPIARLLLDDALLLEGTVQDPADMGRRLQALLEQASTSALGEASPVE